MNKNIKRIIALTLIMGIYSAVEPTKYINLTSTQVQADTASIYLESLSVNKADINFDSNKTNYSANVGGDETEIKITANPKSEDSEVVINGDVVDASEKYKKTIHLDQGENVIKIKVANNDSMSKTYTLIVTKGVSNSDDIYLNIISLSEGTINFQKEAKTYDIDVKSESDKIKIKAKPEDNNDIIRINGTSVTEDGGYEETINLEKGKNQVIVEVENKKGKKRSYILNITRKDNSGGVAQDNIYLDLIKVSDTQINVSKDKTTYDVAVKENIDGTTIQAEPESTKYMVEINGDAVEESKNYEKNVVLNNYKTEVKVKIEDSNNKKRIYTLNIYKGKIPATAAITNNTTTSTATNNSAGLKVNQWVQVNNKWQYNDETGNTIKNSWFYDRSYGKTYYLQVDGSMATGWLSNNGKWYYLGNDGGMKTGWILDGSKYYYLYSDGAMAYSTTVSGYNLGSDGVWSN
ncbi:hypothetical protein psyc5s11_51050 [Clostridium gelidum]|uniref:Cadherin-like beta-sandwich-like domain-containing protein n=1 Tax=Clostridium gelidum TaxID=704125 RepID=A0ABM7TLI0_9CLOT|nr:cadherin-like beta sandwich domain-containing protein [Clostridium gelidum]BCZ49038.1 hypothetical protein psyc5s11_51050 [Clostridium gelidum]